ncbi:hypothetical protein [Sphingomonas sp. Leaf28]|uniref:hypothetical protein n=1 Tax=Sphingomonas sp. Leaf28 TaxID=1735695 RepID=UPI0006F2637F|nr:hypothetical protein [Sphingomonas sp. Leaf28]KQN09095.1 hypothetical protein ASE79_14680 [Sphingomonas sp. Leaf28]
MAGFLELIDNTLGTHFHTPVYDPQTGRKKILRVIELASKQHNEGTTRAPNRSWAAGNNEGISFSPKIDGKPVLIGGKETNFVHKSRFQDFLKGLKAAVEKGDLDKEIKAALDGDAAPRASTSSSSGTRSGRNPLSNVRSSIGRSLGNGKSLEEAEATARANPKFDAAHIDQVVAEAKANAK